MTGVEPGDEPGNEPSVEPGVAQAAPGVGVLGEEWLIAVAEDATRQSGAPAELLGAFLTLLTDAALTGRRPRRSDLSAVHALGRQAATQNVSARQMAHLYLSAAARLWSTVPAAVRTRDRDAVSAAAEAVLLVLDDAVAAVIEGHDLERRRMIRREESGRRQFIDDLLRADSNVAGLTERAEPFGLDLGSRHQVVIAVPTRRLVDEVTLVTALERSITDKYTDHDVLVTGKEGQLVVVAPTAPVAAPEDIATVVHTALSRSRQGGRWQVADGRAHPGPYGVARSYNEARDALALVATLQLDAPVVHARDLLVYRVLVRDRAAMTDLVQEVLAPLTAGRGGAEPLLETLHTYFDTGMVASQTARRMHLSVRAVTYRLSKVAELTGYDPADPAAQLPLHVAVLGARLLGWPVRDISADD